MKKKNISTIILSLAALTSCSSIDVKKENASNSSEKPVVVFYKTEDSALENYTEEYKAEQFDVRGEYIYKGEQLDTQYIDSETIVYKTKLDYGLDEFLEYEEGYSKYPEATNDDYQITITKVKNPKYDVSNPGKESEFVNKKRVYDKKNKYVYVTLKSLDTGGERTIKINKALKEIDPLEVVKEHYPEIARYNDIKKGLDNGRISLDVTSADGLSRVRTNNKDTSSVKYEDLDDMIGEKEVYVRVRVDGFVSERDNFIKKTVYFGDKIEDYANKYEELLADLSNKSLKYSKDGTEVLGGFDEYKIKRLLASEDENLHGKNNTKLAFVTRVLDEKRESPTVGTHRIVREIIQDGKVIFSKKDEVFIDFNSPSILIADDSFFDLSEGVEKRTYRHTPKYTDPKYDYQEMEKDNPEEFLRELSKLKRTHGSTVIGSMIDELSYGKNLFWRGNSIQLIGLEGNRSGRTISDEDLWNVLDRHLENLLFTYPDKTEFYNIKMEIYKKAETTLKPAMEGKIKPFGKPERELSEEEKAAKLKEYYDFLIEKGKEIKNKTENQKLENVDLSYHVVSIGKDDGQGVDPSKAAKYIPKILEENKNIKIVNMSYGADRNYNDYARLVAMTDEEKQKAADEYNNNPLYRFLIQSWLKSEKEKYAELVRKEYTHAFNAIDLYDYFKNLDKITKEDFDKLLTFKKIVTESAISNAPELKAANHDVLFVRSMGNTYSSAKVDLTTFKENGKKNLIEDPNLKYNNNLGSIPSIINYINNKKAIEEGKTYTYDYSYRKNILGAVGVSSRSSVYGMSSNDKFAENVIGTIANQGAIKYKRFTDGMYDQYVSLVKELNEIRRNPDKYPREYEREIEDQIMYIENYSSRNGKNNPLFSLTRAGESMLWSMAAEGEYVYVADKGNKGETLEDGKNFDIAWGSSFAAPRISAVGAKVSEIFPWMSAHQIKQTLLTTAKDDFAVLEDKGQRILTGIYGVDENIGWGVLERDKAFRGPARFVKALTHEVGEENFVAKIDSGIYEFSNSIEGAFDPLRHMISRNKLSQSDLDVINNSQNEDEARRVYNEKIVSYLASLPFEERELFFDAGLVKEGKGTLILSGDNKYSADTVIKDGTLIVKGGSKSNHYIEKGAKLKLDINDEGFKKQDEKDTLLPIEGNVHNKGSLYSYSDKDVITGRYIPYMDSKTYVSPISLLSVGYLDLSNTNDFTLEVFRNQGITKYFSKFTVAKIFEAKANADEVKARVKLGKFAVSEKLSLTLEYDGTYLLGKLSLGGIGVAAEDKRPSNAKLPFLGEIEEKLKEEREKLDKEAEERRKRLEEAGIIPKPIEPNPNADLLRVENALDELVYLDKKSSKTVNGEALADSLTAGYEISSLKSSLFNDFFNKKISDKFELEAKAINEIGISRGSLDNTIITTDMKGGYLALTNKGITLSGDILSGNQSYDNIKSTKFTSFGLNVLAKKEYDALELRGAISGDLLLKTVVKDYLFENRVEQAQNQYNLVASIGAGYKFNISDNFYIKPNLSLDTHLFVFDKYENKEAILGLKYDRQTNTKLLAKLGIDSKVSIDKDSELNLAVNYSRWLSDPRINLEFSSAHFEEVKDEVNSISLNQDDIRFNIGYNKKFTNNFGISLNYGNKNINTNNFAFGLNYTF